MKSFVALMLLGLASAVAQPARAVAIGQIDTFQANTTENWFAGGLGFGQFPPVPPHVVADGGPGGAGDAYLAITAQGGNGAGSRLVAMNASQWAGNYLASGIAGIRMDLINLGNTDLTIRLLFEDPMGGPPNDEAVTAFGVLLRAGTGWTPAFFPTTAADLVALTGSATTVLGQTTPLRIIHAPLAGDALPVVGILGVDNIAAQALAVGEPLTLALLVAGLLALLPFDIASHRGMKQ